MKTTWIVNLRALLCAAVLACLPVWAQSPWDAPFAALEAPAHQVRTQQVSAELVALVPDDAASARRIWLGLKLHHAPHWHTYWQNPGDSGEATQLTWHLPHGFTAAAVNWPAPVKFPVGTLANYGYDGTVVLPVALTLPQPWPATVRVALDARWLVCQTTCLPQSGHFELDVALPQTGATSKASNTNGTAMPPASASAELEQTLRNLPQPLPTASPLPAQAGQTGLAERAMGTATVADGHITLRTEALPAAWRGHPVQLYPETPAIIPPAADGVQHWQGKLWQWTVPLNPLRNTAPAVLPATLALRGHTGADGVPRNAAGQASYRVLFAVQGTWPPAAAQADIPPALAQALQAAAHDAQQHSSSDQPASLGVWLALGMALAGGLLLNLMPCVFPVLAIKILGFARHAHSPAQLRASGLAYSAGVLASFLALAALLLVLRSAGQHLGWGFQLQNPVLVAGLAALFAVSGLNLAGVFEVRHLLPARAMQLAARHPVADALLSGVLAVLVASPCTAPLMGAALGYAVAQPAAVALSVFAAMGLGLALPVLVGSFFPRLVQWLPQPGAWMHMLRQLMAFPMFATVIWLVWVLGQQNGMLAATLLLALILALAGLLWALQQAGRARWVLGAIFAALLAWLLLGHGAVLGSRHTALAISAEAAAASATSHSGEPMAAAWQPWAPHRVEQALAHGQPVLVDYTAAWCVTCQVNKQLVLNQPAFVQAAHARNVLLLRADWTRNDPAITQSLRQLGRSGVPVYALYSPQRPHQPRVLSELLTLSAVLEALEKL